jgi:hypothetical protein
MIRVKAQHLPKLYVCPVRKNEKLIRSNFKLTHYPNFGSGSVSNYRADKHLRFPLFELAPFLWIIKCIDAKAARGE